MLAVSILALALWVSLPAWPGTAAFMLAAGAAQAARLARWAGDRTLSDRLVLILHVGYTFVPLGFVILAGAILFPHSVPISAGIHAWTVGAIGTMTLAIMTRASLGPHRSGIGGRAADTSYLCRRCVSGFAPHGGGVRTRCCSAVARSWRGLDRGVLGIRHRLRPVVAAATLQCVSNSDPVAHKMRSITSVAVIEFERRRLDCFRDYRVDTRAFGRLRYNGAAIALKR